MFILYCTVNGMVLQYLWKYSSQ